jgi:hypothetical protein
MISPGEVFSQLTNFVDLAVQYDLALVGNETIRSRDRNLLWITWKPNAGSEYRPRNSQFATIDEYYECVKAQAFTVLLYDGSVLQLQFAFRGSALDSYRMCYYPCPFEVKPADLRQDPPLDVIEVYRSAGERHLRLRSPVRFDYSPATATPGHSASHVHVSMPCCRCSVVAPLSPGHFIRFVFRHFYPQLWREHAFLRESPQRLGNRTILPEEEALVHLACLRKG